MKHQFRVGQIVPSSNTTMETEIPAMLRAREAVRDERFTFHSSRMRMQKVTKEQLEAMNADSLRCAAELSDAEVDVMGYACLVAIMSMGRGYHRTCEERLRRVADDNGHPAPVVTSAGALVQGLNDLKVKRIAIVTPYLRPLTDLVVDYIEDLDIDVIDSLALEIPDNLEVGRRDPLALLRDLDRLNTDGTDAVVISACVQMPSLAAIEPAQDKLGLPVTSAAACTTRKLLEAMNLEPVTPGAGAVLAPV